MFSIISDYVNIKIIAENSNQLLNNDELKYFVVTANVIDDNDMKVNVFFIDGYNILASPQLVKEWNTAGYKARKIRIETSYSANIIITKN